MRKFGKKRTNKNSLNEAKLRPNVALVIFSSEGKILVGKRAGAEIWQLPQGGIEMGTLVEAAFKEAHEELGISRNDLVPIDVLDYLNVYKFKAPKDYGDEVYHGQSQRFIVFKFIGTEVDLSKCTSNELSEVKWVTLDEFVCICDPVRRKAYEEIVKEIKRKNILLRL
ncbi:MAG: NUDIX domain-containing protein [Deltaproteobacteria bacterium]|nr:NUDIX domain-containing protein [Deltaproteobacteria bacterium]MCX7952940.1 NUDIX domain-containing protein [Deltaproteobacteria bacterium]